ncbi:hypothetical protein BHE74_00045077 [Ensete ventricosum]|nr:hypothetical protein GW17_00043626 [Ensete ventricosum]RWW48836.1 hypothetical protein BHE74_00045077 [Ensete ventricosum]RZS10562.1 hypothetical protein BHM03_00041812 [Ensete ventricosum]
MRNPHLYHPHVIAAFLIEWPPSLYTCLRSHNAPLPSHIALLITAAASSLAAYLWSCTAHAATRNRRPHILLAVLTAAHATACTHSQLQSSSQASELVDDALYSRPPPMMLPAAIFIAAATRTLLFAITAA